jgi:hypothetical protein
MNRANSEWFSEDRGQSEIVGFALSFGIILAVTISLAAFAPTLIDDARADEGDITMQQKMVLLDQHVQDVREGASSRKYSMNTPRGTLSQPQATTIEVSGESGTESITVETRPVKYETSEGTEIVYESIGFVGRNSSEQTDSGVGLVYQNENAFRDNNNRVNEDRNIITIPVLKEQNGSSVIAGSSSTVVRYNITQRNHTTRNNVATVEADGSNEVEMRVDSVQPDMWRAYFEKSTVFDSVSESDGNVTGTMQLSGGSEEVVVASKKINMTYDTTTIITG